MTEITLSGPNFILTLPSDISDRKREVVIPATPEGLSALKRILLSRQREERRTIGTSAAPTQQMVEQWLQAERQAVFKEERKRIPSAIADLDIGALDL